MTVQLVRPRTVEEAVDAVDADEAHLVSGGVSLVLMMNTGLIRPARLVLLNGVPGLTTVRRSDHTIDIGSLCTHDELARNDHLQEALPALAAMFSGIGNIRVRMAGTIGGNLAHADPAQDPGVVLAVLGASVVVRGRESGREIAVQDLADGPLSTTLAPDEVITRVLIPAPAPGSGCGFVKFLPGTREDYATVTAACRVDVDRSGRVSQAAIACGGVGATVVKLESAAQLLLGQRADEPDVLAAVRNAVADGVSPSSDRRGSADYKRAMAGVVALRALADARRGSGGGARTSPPSFRYHDGPPAGSRG